MSDSPIDNAKDGSVIPVRFTRLYLTMLIILAVILTAGQGLTQWRFGGIDQELSVVRHTALQRHQSQQIVKQVLQVTDASEQSSFNENVAELRRLFPVFERYHLQTREGRTDDPKIHLIYDDNINRLYEGIRPQFEAFQQSAHRIMRLQRFDEVKQPDVQASLKLMLANEKPFLEKIDGIVVVCNSDFRAKLSMLRSIELYLYVFTVIALVGIGLLIFRPAARKLKQTFAQLIEAESQTTAANKKLLSANKSLKETRQKLFEATKQQYEQQIDDQKLRTSYLIAGQEEERKRMSRELHDGLGQMLTAIKLQIEGLEAGITRAAATEQNGTPSYSKNLKTLKSLITQTIQETRTISNNLMPSVLSDFGVVPAIKMLAEHDRNETLDVTFKTNFTADMPRLDRNIEIMLYRVTQEAVSNAVRHAKPSHIHIELKERGNSLQLTVSDDGKGFQVPRKNQPNELMKPIQENITSTTQSATLRPPSQGLHNIQERTKLVNGKFKLTSTPGKGTKLQVSVPYQTHLAHHDTY
ncbi:sensor histidine kinase [Spirosoma foliorum]|uniref:Type IV pili methyl-accepting chemotaxis transducer N-terminal domain-containing protein n=1 Tax=Spirosoma foliorum TaxID=2710596 RepID=A0A7G5GN38_9BACT|nr:sensor histidine kinase [Spirosoma foliorum]QMW00280.1 type IV pili methyl-accepting chemotaxis transducer N-terminal domain-containing protein [Spirosoma foliorum]